MAGFKFFLVERATAYCAVKMSPARNPPRDPPPTLACRALPRAGNDRVFLRAARAFAFGSQNGAGSRRFFPKKVYYGGAPGLESGKIDFSTISSTYALPFSAPPQGEVYLLPFSRTIPVRTPQSASRTEVSRPLCHGRAPLTAGRTDQAAAYFASR